MAIFPLLGGRVRSCSVARCLVASMGQTSDPSFSFAEESDIFKIIEDGGDDDDD